jgi:hypothetical protein
VEVNQTRRTEQIELTFSSATSAILQVLLQAVVIHFFDGTIQKHNFMSLSKIETPL